MAKKHQEQVEAAQPAAEPIADEQAVAGGADEQAEQEQQEQREQREQAETVECAVLHDNVYGKHGQIVRLAPNIAEAARVAGYVDTHPNAIAWFREQAK